MLAHPCKLGRVGTDVAIHADQLNEDLGSDMRRIDVTLRMDLTSHQLRGLTALTRCLGPMDIERIAGESGEAECILSALDQLQQALSGGSDVEGDKTAVAPSQAQGRGRCVAGRQNLKGLEVILRGGARPVDAP